MMLKAVLVAIVIAVQWSIALSAQAAGGKTPQEIIDAIGRERDIACPLVAEKSECEKLYNALIKVERDTVQLKAEVVRSTQAQRQNKALAEKRKRRAEEIEARMNRGLKELVAFKEKYPKVFAD